MTKFYTYKSQVHLLAGQVLKFMKGKGYYAAAAAIVIAGGVGGGIVAGGGGPIVTGPCAGATSCITPIVGTTISGGGPQTLGGVTSANIWITKPGDPAGSCTRSSSAVSYQTALAGNNTCGFYSSQFLNAAVSIASLGDTIGVPGGTYSGMAKQFIDYESRLQDLSPACDPLGTWGNVNTTNCIRIAPQSGQQAFFTSDVEFHTGDIWLDGSATGTVTDELARTYSFKFPGEITSETDFGNPGPVIDHNTFTGFWTIGMSMRACHFCRYSQFETGPRIHVEKAGESDCANGGNTADGSSGVGVPNPSTFTPPKTAPPTGYIGTGLIQQVGGEFGVTIQNSVWDHGFFFYANNVSDLACDPHDGGFYLIGNIDSLDIRDNVWRQNEGYDIQVQPVGCNQPNGCPNDGVTIENNFFGQHVNSMRSAAAGTAGCPAPQCFGPDGDTQAGEGSGAIQVDMGTSNWIVRYNSFADGDQLNVNYGGCGGGCTYNNWQVYGNVGPAPTNNGGACTSIPGTGNSFGHNVWTSGTACSGTDIAGGSAAGIYTSTSIPNPNFFLKGAPGSTAADNAISGVPAPTSSIDGAAVGSSPWDAGAQQR